MRNIDRDEEIWEDMITVRIASIDHRLLLNIYFSLPTPVEQVIDLPPFRTSDRLHSPSSLFSTRENSEFFRRTQHLPLSSHHATILNTRVEVGVPAEGRAHSRCLLPYHNPLGKRTVRDCPNRHHTYQVPSVTKVGSNPTTIDELFRAGSISLPFALLEFPIRGGSKHGRRRQMSVGIGGSGGFSG